MEPKLISDLLNSNNIRVNKETINMLLFNQNYDDCVNYFKTWKIIEHKNKVHKDAATVVSKIYENKKKQILQETKDENDNNNDNENDIDMEYKNEDNNNDTKITKQWISILTEKVCHIFLYYLIYQILLCNRI